MLLCNTSLIYPGVPRQPQPSTSYGKTELFRQPQGSVFCLAEIKSSGPRMVMG